MTCRSSYDIFTYDRRTTTVVLPQTYYYRRTMTDMLWQSYAAESIAAEGGKNMISSDVIRGYNDTIILYLLLKEPSYGYEISKQIRSISEEKYIIKETTLYSAFTRMETNGYIESFYEETEESGGKRRTYYRITEAGRKYYREKCEEWNLTKEVIGRFITREEEK